MPERALTASALQPSADFTRGELVRFVGDCDEPLPGPGGFTFSDLAELTFSVMEVSDAGVRLGAPHLDHPETPLVVLVPPHALPALEHVSVWPVLERNFPQAFRIAPRRGGTGHRLEVASGRFVDHRYVFAAEVTARDTLHDPELRIERRLRDELAKMEWPWRLTEPHDGPVVAVVTIDVPGDPARATREVTGEADCAGLALARAFVVGTELYDALDAVRCGGQGRGSA